MGEADFDRLIIDIGLRLPVFHPRLSQLRPNGLHHLRRLREGAMAEDVSAFAGGQIIDAHAKPGDLFNLFWIIEVERAHTLTVTRQGGGEGQRAIIGCGED